MPTLKREFFKKNTAQVVYFSLSFIIITMMGCYGKKQIVIADSLQSNSNRWEAVTKGGGFDIGKTNFGTYKTIQSEKLDSTKLKTKSYSFWDLHLSPTNETETKRKVYSLYLIHGSDTAKVLLNIKITNFLHFKGAFSMFDEDTSREMKEATGIIVLNSTKESWNFLIYPYGVLNFRHYSTKGLLWNKNDTININPISNFKNVNQRVVFLAHSKGLSLEKKGKTIAALQLLGKNYVWISKDLPNDTQLVIAGLFSTILSSMEL